MQLDSAFILGPFLVLLVSVSSQVQSPRELDKFELCHVICRTVSSQAPKFTGDMVSRNMQRMFDFTLPQVAADRGEILTLQRSNGDGRLYTMYGTAGQCSNCK